MLNLRHAVFVGVLMLSALGGWSEDTPLRLDFSGSTLEENQISIQGAGFDTYPRGTLTFGSVPTDNAFTNATDGQGAIITCEPGQGLMIFAPAVQSQGALFVRCSVRASASHGAMILATVDQGANTFISTNTPNNGGYFLNQYRRLALLSIPSTGGILSLIQILNTSETDPLIVYLDNFEIYSLDSQKYYSAEFIDGDENDPSQITSDGGIQPTATSTSLPLPTSTPTVDSFATPTPTTAFYGFISITGYITASDDGSGIEGASISIKEIAESTTQSFYGGLYYLFASAIDIVPPFTLVIEVEGYERYEKVLSNDELSGSTQLNIALTPLAGMTRTPTPTFYSFPTPTSTPVPSGAAVGVRLTACEPIGPVYIGLNFYVDLIDAQGRIVNPGTDGGDASKTVTLSVNGSAFFSNSGNKTQDVIVNQAYGAQVSVTDNTAEKVSITASAPNLTSSDPLTVEFVPTGIISGTIRVWDGQQYITPSDLFDLDVSLIDSDSEYDFAPYFSRTKNGGYRIGGLTTGTYSIRFDPEEDVSIPIIGDPLGETLQWVCINNISVTNGRVTGDVNIDLGPRNPGASVTGTLVRSDGEPIKYGYVYLYPSNYLDDNYHYDCNTKYFYENVLNVYPNDPNFEAKFEFVNVPAGTYLLQGVNIDYDSESEESIYFSNGTNQIITVGTQDVDTVVQLDPMGVVVPLAPVDFDRIQSPPTFVWEMTGNSSGNNLNISVTDRCYNSIWSQKVNGTQVLYSGPALSNQTIYSWSISPENATNLFNWGYSSSKGIPYFLVQ